MMVFSNHSHLGSVGDVLHSDMLGVSVGRGSLSNGKACIPPGSFVAADQMSVWWRANPTEHRSRSIGGFCIRRPRSSTITPGSIWNNLSHCPWTYLEYPQPLHLELEVFGISMQVKCRAYVGKAVSCPRKRCTAAQVGVSMSAKGRHRYI
jgi:hypothetical protein